MKDAGPLDTALRYAARGWQVLPLHWLLAPGTENAACSCQEGRGCDSKGKHPRYHPDDLPHGLNSATSDEAVIRKWWRRWPRANVGLATGEASGFWVLDVDTRHGGSETLAALVREHGPIPETVEAITGGGGRHVLFLMPDFEIRNVQRKPLALGAGLDVRGTGGLIAAEPSIHASGRGYVWEVSAHPDDIEIAPAPEWLLARVKAAISAREQSGAAAELPERIPHGTQHQALVSIAGSMRRRGCTADEIEAALLVINERRCERPGPPENIRKIAQSVAAYKPAEGRPGAAVRDDAPPERKTQQPQHAANGNGKAPLVPVPATYSAPDLDRMEFGEMLWAVPGIIPEGLTIFAGKQKNGKSWLACQAAIAVASPGGKALGRIAVENGEALYLGLEDSARRLKARMRKLLQGAEPPEALTFATEWPRMAQGGGAALMEWLKQHPKARLVVIDTLIRMWSKRAGGQGNAYEEDYAALQQFQRLAMQTGVAVVVVHHARKATSDDVFDEVSGSLGIQAAADTIVLMKRTRGQPTGMLHVTGRDVETVDLVIRWDPHAGWTLVGEADDAKRSAVEERILDGLREAETRLRPADLAPLIEMRRDVLKVYLWRMAEKGLVVSVDGWYSLPESNLSAQDDPFAESS